MEGKVRVLVADTDVEYSASFVRYLSERQGSKYTVALVNNPEKLEKLMDAGYRADVLLVAPQYIKMLEAKVLNQLLSCFEGILVLKENNVASKDEAPKFRGYLGIVMEINKYQNAETLISEVDKIFLEAQKLERPRTVARGVAKIAVYSPIGGSGRTFLACLIAKYLASIKKKVLLQVFEDVTSLGVFFENLPLIESEFCLGIKTREGAIEFGEYVWKDEKSGVDVLLVANAVSEACELSSDEVEKIFQTEHAGYDFVISELGAWDSLKAIKGLQHNDLVLFPMRDDESSKIKARKWVEFCSGYDGESFERLLGKCICIRICQTGFENSSDVRENGFAETLNIPRFETQAVESKEVREIVAKLL